MKTLSSEKGRCTDTWPPLLNFPTPAALAGKPPYLFPFRVLIHPKNKPEKGIFFLFFRLKTRIWV